MTFRDYKNDLVLISLNEKSEIVEKLNLTTIAKAPKASSSANILETPNGIKIFYLDETKNVIVLKELDGKWGFTNWTAKSGIDSGIGPLGVMMVNNQEHVFFRTINNEVGHIIYEDGRFRIDNWTTKANRWSQMANAPKVVSGISAQYVNGQENIYYLDEHNNIQNLFYSEGKFTCINLSEKR